MRGHMLGYETLWNKGTRFSKIKQTYLSRLNEYKFVNVQVNIFGIKFMPIDAASNIIRRCVAIQVNERVFSCIRNLNQEALILQVNVNLEKYVRVLSKSKQLYLAILNEYIHLCSS